MRKTTSTNYENQVKLEEYCSASKTLSMISGRWKLSLLFALFDQELSYSEFKNTLPGISDRMLSNQLKQLEEDGLLLKHVSKPGVYYTLSDQGKSLKPILLQLSGWGKQNIPPQPL
ncbi:helix-turn-helix domain-containing protein [Rapidithrix thailandica]|uniref:Helix-turn-helix domain-containing protein n=1 Tax=Rapidithrix thailandica TaxID=413964 RepID=A0AAW9S926_9BACT